MKEEKKDRKKLFSILFLILIGVLSVSIVYAALSTTLLISGTAEVQSASWGVTVEAMPADEYYGSAVSQIPYYKDNFIWSGYSEILDYGEINGTTISNINISVTAPGDFVGGLYKVTNTGSIPMVFDSYDIFDLVITSDSGNQSDVEWGYTNVVSNLEVVRDEETSVEIGDVICPGDYFYFALEIGIEDVDSIPSDSLNISNWGSNLVFVQGGSNLCS